MKERKSSAFEQSATEKEPSLLAELCAMLKQNKKYWLLPIVLILLALGLLVLLGGTAAAPFIYTLF
jgi:hypothetical protein